ncbi:hypothetical protein ACFE04_028066 [Oxalis oulophora]
MATPAAAAPAWLRGKVKSVPSGDCLVIVSMANPTKEKTLTLSNIIAPRLARRGGVDEPFAWQSREFVRNLCIGKEVVFRVEYAVSSIGREFGTVFLADKNVATLLVTNGWAKVRQQGQQKSEGNKVIEDLLNLEDQAKEQGLGMWNKDPEAVQKSVRDLPPSAIGNASNFDAEGLVAANKGKPLQAIVEQVRDGSTVRVYLLPDFQFVQVFVAGVQSPSMGRRGTSETVVVPDVTTVGSNGAVGAESKGPLTSAQRLAVSSGSSTEVAADPFGPEAKHFTEIRTLNREVRIIVEGHDKSSNLIGSVFYPDGESAKDLALELVENGLAKYVEWSAKMLEGEAQRNLKNAELEAKKTKLKIWKNYVPPATNSKAIHDQNFTGKVVEIVSGDCIIVSDDSVSFGSPLAERRVNLSSIRCPKMGNPRRNEKPAPYAREAKEFLRTRLIGKQVNVQMEYSRKVPDGLTDAPAAADSRVMDFGSVFLISPTKADGDDTTSGSTATANQPAGTNVGEWLVGRGFATVIRHRDFEERSNYYDALLAAESRAISGKKGTHSARDPPGMHIQDLSMAASKKARDFLPFLQRLRCVPAVVEYVFSGHRFKLYIPKETCSIAFSLSGVRCPGREEPYSEEAIALMRRKIMQRDVEIEVETVDRNGTFLGSLWESKANVAVSLVEAGLAKLQTSFGSDRIPDIHLLEQAQHMAKQKKLKIWENYVEGEEVQNGSAPVEGKQKEVLKVVVTEVLDEGKFYVQTVGDQRVAAIQQQLASLNVSESAPVIGAFSPKKGDLVLAQFSQDDSWNRAMIVNAPRGPVESPKDKFEVFYIDYGNQEVVPYSRLRPIDPSVSAAPGISQLCKLAYIKVPTLDEEYGEDAGHFLSEQTLSGPKEFRAMIEEKDLSGGKVKGQGTGPILFVTLVAVDSEISVNSAMVQEGLARMEKRKKWDHRERKAALDCLEKFQDEAKSSRRRIWQYGDIESDEEDVAVAAKKTGGRR